MLILQKISQNEKKIDKNYLKEIMYLIIILKYFFIYNLFCRVVFKQQRQIIYIIES